MENENFWKWQKYIFEKSDSEKKKFFGNFRSQKAQKQSFVEKLELFFQGLSFEIWCPLAEPIWFGLWVNWPLLCSKEKTIMPNFVSKYWTYDHPPNTICQKVYKVTLCHFLLESEQKIDGAAHKKDWLK